MHGHVTHAFILTFIPPDVLSLVFPLMLECLSFPTHSFFLVSLPFYSTQVCVCVCVCVCVWTSVHLNIGLVSVKYRAGVLIQVYNIYYKHDSPVSRLYISQTHSLKARLWGKCHRHFPIFKKRALPAVLFCSFERNALKFTHGSSRRPKSTINWYKILLNLPVRSFILLEACSSEEFPWCGVANNSIDFLSPRFSLTTSNLTMKLPTQRVWPRIRHELHGWLAISPGLRRFFGNAYRLLATP